VLTGVAHAMVDVFPSSRVAPFSQRISPIRIETAEKRQTQRPVDQQRAGMDLVISQPKIIPRRKLESFNGKSFD
jgi:hypothetical protein